MIVISPNYRNLCIIQKFSLLIWKKYFLIFCFLVILLINEYKISAKNNLSVNMNQNKITTFDVHFIARKQKCSALQKYFFLIQVCDTWKKIREINTSYSLIHFSIFFYLKHFHFLCFLWKIILRNNLLA